MTTLHTYSSSKEQTYQKAAANQTNQTTKHDMMTNSNIIIFNVLNCNTDSSPHKYTLYS